MPLRRDELLGRRRDVAVHEPGLVRPPSSWSRGSPGQDAPCAGRRRRCRRRRIGPTSCSRNSSAVDDAEVAAAAAERPEELLVLVGARRTSVTRPAVTSSAPIEVVAREAVRALEPAASRRRASDRRRRSSRRGRRSSRVRAPASPRRTAPTSRRRRSSRTRIRIDRDLVQPRATSITSPSSHIEAPATECPPGTDRERRTDMRAASIAARRRPRSRTARSPLDAGRSSR